ncbi:hypothetical protein WJ0W_004000 [Paenibacillus melissococcoides]|uniref:Prenylated flavin chaperone LpdD-like domain-containing protein n=1 Tax=Paenibacillus melissococcoides TaxID=2912268 RepID=A0ABM9G4L9_9BACL|nr:MULTISPECIES: hypothetical protein [Paenibacillus]MEB9892155.1 hypothetical protein [Bacillus cereus]CAH8246767.1 hypothetical protein WJ0W_004000 [Paenibacillus melissococcoides]CAH8715694.1 hypothetical protein HTL2_004370 [Paenibacillus melissococcoides]CAH8716652.1 hypothetical protein WDD9_004637 [Paenibacillus melissococcoides]GIO77053.1 hypothetical protein J6TS7_06630 [Paenibacillus dendritiformis]
MTGAYNDAAPPGEDIRVEAIRQGRDWLFLLSGGDAHIGAVSTSWKEAGQWKVTTHAVPGHREDELAAAMALRASEALGTTVTVAAGIHYDQLRKEHIALVVEQAWLRFTTELDRVRREV